MTTPLGETELAPISALLGTSFHHFWSPHGVDGLSWDQGDKLDLLAVVSTHPGTGQFRAFMGACQKHWRQINVLEVWNPELVRILAKAGFKEFRRQEWNGETVKGWQWNLESSTSATP